MRELYRFAAHIPDGDSITAALVWAGNQQEAMAQGFATIGEERARELLQRLEGGDEPGEDEEPTAFFSCELVADALREHPDFYRFSVAFGAELLFTEEYLVDMFPDWTEDRRKGLAEALACELEASLMVCDGACGKEIRDDIEDMAPCAYPRDTDEGDEDFVGYYCPWCLPDEEDDDEDDEDEDDGSGTPDIKPEDIAP
jgi:hypothetical protein